MLSDSILVPVVDSFSYRYVHILIVNMKLYIDNHMHTPKKKKLQAPQSLSCNSEVLRESLLVAVQLG